MWFRVPIPNKVSRRSTHPIPVWTLRVPLFGLRRQGTQPESLREKWHRSRGRDSRGPTGPRLFLFFGLPKPGIGLGRISRCWSPQGGMALSSVPQLAHLYAETDKERAEWRGGAVGRGGRGGVQNGL